MIPIKWNGALYMDKFPIKKVHMKLTDMVYGNDFKNGCATCIF